MLVSGHPGLQIFICSPPPEQPHNPEDAVEVTTSDSETETEVTMSDDEHTQPPDTDAHLPQSDTMQQSLSMINAGASAFEILQNINEIVD